MPTTENQTNSLPSAGLPERRNDRSLRPDPAGRVGGNCGCLGDAGSLAVEDFGGGREIGDDLTVMAGRIPPRQPPKWPPAGAQLVPRPFPSSELSGTLVLALAAYG